MKWRFRCVFRKETCLSVAFTFYNFKRVGFNDMVEI